MGVSSSKTLLLSCPAKLNLYLDVFNKRPDGYHDLRTLFERIALADSVRLTRINSDEVIITSTSADVPLDETNLVCRAAELLKRSRGIKSGVKIELTKQIPVGAGLGGGSSDAASVLLGLNKLFGLKLNRETLISYANRLGSDVAFFILNKKFAIGEGRGGELTSVYVPKGLVLWHILFILPAKVFTKDVYGLLDKEEKPGGRLHRGKESLKLTKKPGDVNILISYLRRNDISSLNQNIYNRLSETVMKSYSLVSEFKTDLLKSGLKNVHMSGSGPTLFTIFKKRKEAEAVFDSLQRRFSHRCRIFLTSTL